MHYYSSLVRDIENIVFDFLEYRKKNGIKDYRIQGEFAENNDSTYYEDIKKEYLKEYSNNKGLSVFEKLKNNFEQLVEPMHTDKYCAEKHYHIDKEYIHHLYCHMNKELNHIVMEIIRDFEHEFCITKHEHNDREVLYKVIDKVTEVALCRIDELKCITKPGTVKHWTIYALIRSNIEALVMVHLNYRKKHHHKGHRSMMDYELLDNNMYDYPRQEFYKDCPKDDYWMRHCQKGEHMEYPRNNSIYGEYPREYYKMENIAEEKKSEDDYLL